MDISTVTAAIAGLKNAIDLARTAMDARDAAKLSDAKSAMLERLIEIQSQCFDLQQVNQQLLLDNQTAATRVAELQRKLDTVSDIRRDIDENFEVVVSVSGSTYLASKVAEGQSGKQLICATCAAAGTKSFLQRNSQARNQFVCSTHGPLAIW
ncbi:hypothetical protein [Burkholderia ubonensis]|uniref:Uncharacterized protein n=1 Tax=Burkholderia ubonensis TaxID=101571 RepID=A0ABD4DXA5_9BURK|nr:hypothetical protein [Burkholderia ubonensis]KVN79391.1 hypothetical protein WJ68_22080 [Burkholderia ubonensis]